MNDTQQYEVARKRIAQERLAKLPSVIRELEENCPAIFQMFRAYADGREGYLEALEGAVVTMASRMQSLVEDFKREQSR